MTTDPLAAGLAAADSISDEWTRATIRGLLIGYDARWREAQIQIVVDRIEEQLESALPNLNTNGCSRTFRLAGKLDKIGPATIYDHKTTTQDIADPSSTYWRQLEIDSQPSHYELLANAHGIQIDRVIWDVTRRPTIKPKKVAKKDVAALASLGTYCGRSFDPAIAELGMLETPEMFEARVEKLVTEEPDKYYQRRGCKRTRDELIEYAREVWAVSQDMLTARREGRHYKNSGACMHYGTPCAFLGICSGHDTPDSDRWMMKACVHEELDCEGDGRELLTNSRIKTFHQCRRKHYYAY